MKSFTKKSFLQKIIITILVALLLSNLIVPTISKAETDSDEIGGVLFSPIQFLTLALGDTLLLVANSCAYGELVDPIMTLSESWNAFSISRVALSIISRTNRNGSSININSIRIMGI